MSTAQKREFWPLIVVAISAALIVALVVAIISFGTWIFQPIKRDMFTQTGAASCILLAGDRALLQLPIGGTGDTIDKVQLMTPDGLSIAGADLVGIPYSATGLPTVADLAAMAPLKNDFYELPPVGGHDQTLVVVVQRDPNTPTAAAHGLSVFSYPGEPVFVDDQPLNIRLSAGACTIAEGDFVGQAR
jgi:hypothetical protein